MRPGLLVVISAALLLPGCGDDGKVAPRGPADGARPPSPSDAMASWETQPPVVQERANTNSWARTRPGDTATWEIRLTGSPMVTRLTWMAVAVEGGFLRFEVESTTTDGAGRVVSTAASRDERHAVGAEVSIPLGTAKPFELAEVGGTRIRQVRQAGPRPDGVIIAVSDQVPFGGLVRRREDGLDQVLVSFSMGR